MKFNVQNAQFIVKWQYDPEYIDYVNLSETGYSENVYHIFKTKLGEIAKGRTWCFIFRDGILKSTGIADCSRNDQFNKSIGRKLSFKRAIDNMLKGFANKDVRETAWNEFFRENPKRKQK